MIFPQGDKLPHDNFTGDAWLHMLVADKELYNCAIGNVTFAPGARNNWHKHSGGQLLLVTSGTGYYQEKGKPARVIRAGDVVTIPADVEHWHGATAQTAMTHLAISTNLDKNANTWLAPVSDEEYAKLSVK